MQTYVYTTLWDDNGISAHIKDVTVNQQNTKKEIYVTVVSLTNCNKIRSNPSDMEWILIASNT